jgi:hypothetical protein
MTPHDENSLDQAIAAALADYLSDTLPALTATATIACGHEYRRRAITARRTAGHRPDSVDLAFAALMRAVAIHYEPASSAVWWIDQGRFLNRHILDDLAEHRCPDAIRSTWENLHRNPLITPKIAIFRLAFSAWLAAHQGEDE